MSNNSAGAVEHADEVHNNSYLHKNSAFEISGDQKTYSEFWLVIQSASVVFAQICHKQAKRVLPWCIGKI